MVLVVASLYIQLLVSPVFYSDHFKLVSAKLFLVFLVFYSNHFKLVSAKYLLVMFFFL